MNSVRVQTGARLHWGLFRPSGPPGDTLFGGVGLMVTEPGTMVKATRREVGRHGSARFGTLSERFGCRDIELELEAAPPAHAGFGSGTQSALAAAWAVARLSGQSEDPAALMAASGRGKRSAIGCHGFFQGGLLLDDGKRRDSAGVAPLLDRVDLPDEWRVVVVLPEEPGEWHGRREVEAFMSLPGRDDLAHELRRMAGADLLPAARAGDFRSLGPIVHRFNTMAGQAFSSVQGGVFASPRIAETVHAIRAWGIEGVGQSSWGPAVFALCRDSNQASWLAGKLANIHNHGLWESKPSRHGALLNDGARTP
ncbi:MAG: beta-ribofuranosylaminobenzene 5'-phosphate synthase [Planctomycetes bacterium]|nr:beta-ribofuranosylaminobenzene 5'-phosphate synthase [Planctomycetota bacterium]